MNEQEREAFEAWNRQDLLDMPVHQDPKERQFRTWQARAALAAKVPAGFVLVPVEPEMLHCAEMWDDGFQGAWRRALAATPAPAPEADALAKAHEARRQAQSEVAYLKARLSGARLILMRELKEQGWTPPAPAQAQQAADDTFSADQWWYAELDGIAKTADQRRAMAVVRNLMRQFAVAKAKPEAQQPLCEDEVAKAALDASRKREHWQHAVDTTSFSLGARWGYYKGIGASGEASK